MLSNICLIINSRPVFSASKHEPIRVLFPASKCSQKQILSQENRWFIGFASNAYHGKDSKNCRPARRFFTVHLPAKYTFL